MRVNSTIRVPECVNGLDNTIHLAFHTGCVLASVLIVLVIWASYELYSWALGTRDAEHRLKSEQPDDRSSTSLQADQDGEVTITSLVAACESEAWKALVVSRESAIGVLEGTCDFLEWRSQTWFTEVIAEAYVEIWTDGHPGNLNSSESPRALTMRTCATVSDAAKQAKELVQGSNKIKSALYDVIEKSWGTSATTDIDEVEKIRAETCREWKERAGLVHRQGCADPPASVRLCVVSETSK